MRRVRQTVLDCKLTRTDETLTAQAGLALLAEYSHGLGLRGLVDRHLPVPGSHRGDAPSVFVDAVVLLLQAGGRHLEDLRDLEREAALRRLVGRDPLPDPDTVGDWLRRMGDPLTGQAGLVGLGQVRDTVTARILRRDPVSDDTLDADAMQVEGEKREAQWTYQQVQGYMPRLGFWFESGLGLLDEFREGNVSPQTGQLGFYRACQARLPPGKRLARYRADRASYQADLLNALEDDGVHWAITADQDAAVKAVIHPLPETAWTEPVVGGGDAVAETVHTMNKTRQAVRLIVNRWQKPQPSLLDEPGEPYAYHAVASNGPEEQKGTAAVLAWHNQRGQAENFNKELNGGFGLEQRPCGQFGANAVFFRLGVLAYNLFLGFNRLVCPAAWARHTIATVRWKLVQLAGRIVRHAGQVVRRLVADADLLTLCHGIRARCWVLSQAP